MTNITYYDNTGTMVLVFDNTYSRFYPTVVELRMVVLSRIENTNQICLAFFVVK